MRNTVPKINGLKVGVNRRSDTTEGRINDQSGRSEENIHDEAQINKMLEILKRVKGIHKI